MNHLFLVTTETSGDLLGGRLVRALKAMQTEVRISGVGGDQLVAEGMDTTYHVRDFNVMGLFEVLSQLKRLKAMFAKLVEQVLAERPKVVLLIDAPDFNMRFAKALKGSGIPVIYYVSPQVWAWRRKRASQLAAMVDHILLLFSFEQDIYRSLDVDTTWVGHPLVEELTQMGAREDFFRDQQLDKDRPLVALAPGSRKSEVTRLLPVMADVARARHDRYQFALPLAPTIDAALATELLGDAPVRVLPGQMRPLMAHADGAVVASGTATLETALLGTPMIVGYKLKSMSYLLARSLVKVPHIALVNLVLNDRVVPELVQGAFCLEKILPELDEIMIEGPRRAQIIAEFARLEDILGGGGASHRAAKVVKDYLTR